MNVSVSIPDYDIVASGNIVLNSRQDTFEIKIEDIKLLFNFIPGTGEAKAQADQVEGKTAKFTLQNFDSSLGITYELKDIVTVDNRKVSLVLYINSMEKEPVQRSISYTLTTIKA